MGPYKKLYNVCVLQETLEYDDVFFQSELGWSVWGSLDWTKTASGLNLRMPDRLGCGRIVAMLTCGL